VAPGVINSDYSESSLTSSYLIYLVASISIVAIGLVLILLGLQLDTRRKPLAIAGLEEPVT